MSFLPTSLFMFQIGFYDLFHVHMEEENIT